MENMQEDELIALKEAYGAYVQLPLRSTRRLMKHKAYTDLLYRLSEKYHLESNQLRVLVGDQI